MRLPLIFLLLGFLGCGLLGEDAPTTPEPEVEASAPVPWKVAGRGTATVQIPDYVRFFEVTVDASDILLNAHFALSCGADAPGLRGPTLVNTQLGRQAHALTWQSIHRNERDDGEPCSYLSVVSPATEYPLREVF